MSGDASGGKNGLLPAREFILENTRLQSLPHVPEVTLHLGDDVMVIWEKVTEYLGETAAPPPFWAFAWPGGQAIARYLLDNRHVVARKRVLDFATGSGLCAIAAMLAGADGALGSDLEPLCRDAVALNAEVNGVHVSFTPRDLLRVDPPEVDLILAGDICYEQPLAAAVLPWLRRAQSRGIDVLIGDPGRTYFPTEGMIRLAQYAVPTAHGLEDRDIKEAGVFRFRTA